MLKFYITNDIQMSVKCLVQRKWKEKTTQLFFLNKTIQLMTVKNYATPSVRSKHMLLKR